MKLFALETSCDETACAFFDWKSDTECEILSEQLNSQIDIHKEYGGVYPAVAKREHTKNVYPLFIACLEEAGVLIKRTEKISISEELLESVSSALDRDPENRDRLVNFYETYEKPDIDAIAVTYGPGLEIALWTGFNFARALCVLFEIDLVPTNHMEGHIYASLITRLEEGASRFSLHVPTFPSLALLVSGGHTELILMKDEHVYEKVGVTQDDAVGEAFDKSARLVGISYPGGPLISKHAAEYRDTGQPAYDFTLPRPMLHSGDLNFSFSGLKTAVRSVVESETEPEDITFKRALSYELESAITEVLEKKTRDAIERCAPHDFVLGGGVSASDTIRSRLGELCSEYDVSYHIPEKRYSGDNAVMIGIAGYRRYINKRHDPRADRVNGRLSLES